MDETKQKVSLHRIYSRSCVEDIGGDCICGSHTEFVLRVSKSYGCSRWEIELKLGELLPSLSVKQRKATSATQNNICILCLKNILNCDKIHIA